MTNGEFRYSAFGFPSGFGLWIRIWRYRRNSTPTKYSCYSWPRNPHFQDEANRRRMIADIELLARSAPAGRGRAGGARFTPSSFSTTARQRTAAGRDTKGRRRAAGARETAGEAIAPVAIRTGWAH